MSLVHPAAYDALSLEGLGRHSDVSQRIAVSMPQYICSQLLVCSIFAG